MQPPHTWWVQAVGVSAPVWPHCRGGSPHRQPLWLAVLFGVCPVEVQEEPATRLPLPGEAVPRGGRVSPPEASARAWRVRAGAAW